jgi:hypothetical protein
VLARLKKISFFRQGRRERTDNKTYVFLDSGGQGSQQGKVWNSPAAPTRAKIRSALMVAKR